MRKANSKPVKACHGCELNLGDHCAVFDDPGRMWHHHACRGYNNTDVIEEYEREQRLEGAYARKRIREEQAKLARTTPHYDGMRPVAR